MWLSAVRRCGLGVYRLLTSQRYYSRVCLIALITIKKKLKNTYRLLFFSRKNNAIFSRKNYAIFSRKNNAIKKKNLMGPFLNTRF